MKFKASQKGRPTRKGARKMAAAAAEIAYGTPVNLTFGEAFADLGVEHRDGNQVVLLAVDDGDGFVKLELSPGQASVLSDVLAGLARVGS
jgi:hypothetical protein